MEWKLRCWRLDDAQSVARYADDPAVAANLRDAFPSPYTLEDAQNYVRSCVEEDESAQLSQAIEVDGHAVGSIGVFVKGDVYRKSAELGYWLSRPYWGRGIMTGAVRKICGEAFSRFDVVRIYAEPFAVNKASRRVLEKAGFRQEGLLRNSVFKNGVLQDSCIYSLLKEEFQGK